MMPLTIAWAIDSTASAVLYELSSFYAQLNRPEKSLEMLRRAVAYSSDNFTYRLALATMSRNLGMFGEASDEYEKLVKDYPGKPELNYYLADALTQEGEIGKAIDAYDALESSIGMSEALSMQKYKLYNALEQNDNAFKEVEKLAAKFPMESRYQIILGDLHLEKNDTVKALKYYQKAHEIDPESPYYIVSMANYYEVVGNKDRRRDADTQCISEREIGCRDESRYPVPLYSQTAADEEGDRECECPFPDITGTASGRYRSETDVRQSAGCAGED